MFHPDDRHLFEDVMIYARESRGEFTFQTRIIQPNGELRHLISISEGIHDKNGNLVTILGIVLDITERMKAEEAYSQVCNLAKDLICVADINTATFLQINPAFQQVLGYSEAELLGKPFLDFIHPDDVEDTVSVIQEKLQKGTPVITFENRYRCKDGSYRYLDWNSHPVPEEGKTYAIAHDMTVGNRQKWIFAQARNVSGGLWRIFRMLS